MRHRQMEQRVKNVIERTNGISVHMLAGSILAPLLSLSLPYSRRPHCFIHEDTLWKSALITSFQVENANVNRRIAHTNTGKARERASSRYILQYFCRIFSARKYEPKLIHSFKIYVADAKSEYSQHRHTALVYSFVRPPIHPPNEPFQDSFIMPTNAK